MACGKSFSAEQVTPAPKVRSIISDLIRRDHPAWSPLSYICRDDLSRYSMEYLESLLHLEPGEISSLGRDALKSLHQHGLLAANVEAAFEKDWTMGRRLGDRIAKIGSSLGFSIAFGALLGVLILTNAVVLYWHPANLYPFILVNLLLTCVVGIQAPILAFSQFPHGAKDRLRSEHNYLMSLKAELGIRLLNQTVSELVVNQREPLMEIQQTLLMMLSRSDQPRSIKSA